MNSVDVAHVTAIDRDDVAADEVVRLNNAWVAADSRPNALVSRGNPVTITTRTNGRKIVRHAAGGGSQAGLGKRTIALDYYGRVSIGARDHHGTYDLVVTRAKPWEVLWHYATHGNVLVRYSTRVMVLSTVASVIWLGQLIWAPAFYADVAAVVANAWDYWASVVTALVSWWL